MLATIGTVFVYTFLLGSLYLLVSLGFSLITGILKVFHFGYGYLFLGAIYFTWMFMDLFHFPLGWAILAMFALQAVLAYVLYRFILVPFRFKQDEEFMFVMTVIFIALILQLGADVFYPIYKGVYLETTVIPGTSQLGGITVSNQLLFAAGVGIVMTLLFVLFFTRTKMGLAVRAISYDVYSSRILGINVEQLFMIVFLMTIIPPIVAILTVAPIWAIDSSIGQAYLGIAILIAVLGGLGNLKGTIIASYIIAFCHSFVAFAIGEPRLMSLVALIVVFIVLILRPEGIIKTKSVW